MPSKNNKNKINTIVIVNDFNYIQGGASKVAIETAKILVNAGFKVYFFSAVNREDNKIDKVNYITTNQNEALKEKNFIKGIINGIYNFKAKYYLKKLLSTLDKNSTVVHVHGWTKALSSSIFDIAFKLDFKVVLTLHDYFTACPNGGFFNYKQLEICTKKPLSYDCIKCDCDSRNYAFKLYRILRQFVQNKIVKLSQKLKYAIGISDLSISVLKSTLNSSIKIKKIYNPINIDSFSQKELLNWKNNNYYLYVGRINKEKGVDFFCKALTDLSLKGIVVGDGSEKKRLEDKYPNIEFVGWKDEKEVTEYMKNAKTIILPSLWYEGAPLTIFEAGALKIPVLVKSSCAGTEFVSKNNIFNDLEELKEKILKQDYNNETIDYNKMSYFNYYNNIMSFYNEIL